MTLAIALKKSFPRFKSRQEEAAFWDTHSFLDFPEQVYPVGDSPDARAYRWLRLQFPERRGWQIAYSPEQRGLFADFIVRNEQEQVLVELQTSRVLPSTIARVRRLQKTFAATSALLLCTGDTRITDKTKAIAQQSDVRIAWLHERRSERRTARPRLAVAETPARYDAG